ncbi:MAG TPA: NAD(P)-dependent oxidoreductase [Bacillota bacterium]
MVLRLAVLAGDARQWAAACVLAARGHDVAYVGRIPAPGPADSPHPAVCSGLPDACAGRNGVIGPLLGLTPDQVDDLLANLHRLAPGAVVAAGRPPGPLEEAARSAGLRLVDWLAWEPLLQLNAVLTADGAVAEAVTAAGRAIWGSRAVVVGFGRVGRSLAVRLRALGAEVTVCARSAGQRAAAAAEGCRALPLPLPAAALAGADFVFNSVPAPVIGGPALASCPRQALLMDLVAPPGGFDGTAAAARGLEVRRSLGIPGRVTPLSAGRILADAVEELFCGGTE